MKKAIFFSTIIMLILPACAPVAPVGESPQTSSSPKTFATTSAFTNTPITLATVDPTFSLPTSAAGPFTPEPTATPTQTATPTKRPTTTSTWDRYKPGTIGQIVSNTDNELTSLAHKAFYYNYGNDYASKVVATYTGQFRPISERRTYLIGTWAEAFGQGEVINLFATEGLFVEDTVAYWLPIQSPLIPLMKDELTEGKPVTLFIIWIGATFFDNELDRVFLVNEFLATP